MAHGSPFDERSPDVPLPLSGDAERRLLAALLETVVQATSLDEILGRLLEQVERCFDARACWIRFLDESTGQLRTAAARGDVTPSILDTEVRPGQGGAGAAFAQQAVRLVPDVQAEAGYVNRPAFAAAGINELIYVPLVARGRAFGVMAYAPRRPGVVRRADPGLITLLSLFAAHAALAIEQASARAQAVAARARAEELARRLAAVQRFEEALTQGADLPVLLGRAAAIAAATLGARHGAVALFGSPDEPGGGDLPAARARPRLVVSEATETWAQVHSRVLPLGRLVALRRLFEPARRALVLEAPGRDPRLGRLGPPLARAGIRQLLLTPLTADGRLFGALAVDDAGGRRPPFGPDDLLLAESFGVRLGAAVDRLQRVEAERRRTRELLALQRTTQQLASTLSLPALLPVVVEEAASLLDADAVVLRLKEGDELVLAAHSPGVPAEEIRPRVQAGAKWGGGQVVTRNAPVVIPDLKLEPEARQSRFWQAMDYRSYLGVPIRTAGVVTGVLGFYARRPRWFALQQAELAATLADMVGVALGNARLFERVSETTREWEASFNAMQEGIALVDTEGRIVRANRSLSRLLGVPAAELVGRPFAELAPGLKPGGEGPRGTRMLALSVSPMADREGRPAGAVCAVRDVTEERRLREQLLQSEKLASIGQLVSGVAHELNNPLAAIMGYTQLLLRHAADPRVARDLAQVLGQAERAARIVQNLLSFARKHRPEKRRLALGDVVRAALDLQGYDLRVSGIEVDLALDPAAPAVMADFHQLEEVVVNLLVNAKQAILEARRSGRIRIETRAVPFDGQPGVRLSVRDDGPGIPREHLHRVFDPFFTTKPVGVGTGLGLSICFGIVQEHGGRIWIESEPGAGATVVIELPAAAAEDPALAAQPAGGPAA
ncbi:MAG TPA: GAF domain-containing protein, partial [Thermodesulfobacteriota bacterium]|nr:GAF domain-containing protein [Thermodesulfobacteriota bacterium]